MSAEGEMGDTITPKELQSLLAGADPPLVLDVRRMQDRENDPIMIPGAEWKDPEKVAEWGGAIGREAVIYCVRGGSVSRSVLEQLRAKEVRVRFVEGGLEAWKRVC